MNLNRFRVNRFFLVRLARCRTSHVDPESKRKLHISRVQGAHFKIGFHGVESYSNLKPKFRYKRPTFAHYHNHYLNMVDENVNELKEILSEEVPLCTGVVPLDTNNSQLFYRNAADGSLG